MAKHRLVAMAIAHDSNFHETEIAGLLNIKMIWKNHQVIVFLATHTNTQIKREGKESPQVKENRNV